MSSESTEQPVLTSKTTTTRTQSGKQPSSSSFIFLEHFAVKDLGLLIEDEKVPCEFKISKIPLHTKLICNKGIEPPVDGLVLYYEEKSCYLSGTSMYICNPKTQIHVKLPDFDFSKRDNPSRGFGSHVKGDSGKKYKVVQIFSFWPAGSEVHVYTLGTDSWRNVGEAPIVNFLTNSGAFLDGSVYWLANKLGVGDVRTNLSKLIVSFDLSSEKFDTFPIGGDSLSSDCRYLYDPGKCFQIVALDKSLVVVDSTFHNQVEISVSNEFNVNQKWHTFFVMKSCVDSVSFERVMIISIQKHGEFFDFILLCDSAHLISFNTETKKAVLLDGIKMRILQNGFPSHFHGPFSYVESLISPPGKIVEEQMSNPEYAERKNKKGKHS